MSSFLKQDIEYLISNLRVLEAFKGKSIFITGATGLIGGCLTQTLCEYESRNDSGLRIYALVRSEFKAREMFDNYIESGILSLVVGDTTDSIALNVGINYVIHGACATSSKFFIERPVETIESTVLGTKNVLELVKNKHVERTLFLSSLEVYGTPESNFRVAEDNVGYIDFMNVRSSYSEGKRLAECLCCSYAREFGIHVSIVRLAQTFGPGVSSDDGRVFAQFARCVINQEDIVLNTAGRTHRNYCYLRDAVSGILTALVKGENCSAYNVANPDTGISIADMAQLVCDSPLLGCGKIKVIFNDFADVDRLGYNPEMKIELATKKIEALGWHAEIGLEEMYVRMIGDMRAEFKERR